MALHILVSFLVATTLLGTSLTSKLCFPEFDPITWSEAQPHYYMHSRTPYLKAREAIRRRFKATFPSPGDNCTAIYLFFFGRHTIRYPGLKEMDKYRTKLPRVQKALLAAGKVPTAEARDLAAWKLLMHDAREHSVTTSGVLETGVIARIFYKYFPSLLDLKHSHIEVATSSKIRTRETAIAFLQELHKVQENRKLTEKELDAKHHITIKDHLLRTPNVKKKPSTGPSLEDLGRSEAAIAMLEQFNHRYGLGNASAVNFDEISLMYSLCAYEISHHLTSTWCNLFTIGELRLLEYFNDIVVYYKQFIVYTKQFASPPMADLAEKLQSIASEGTNNKSATIYFTHDGILKRLIVYLGLFPPQPNTTNITSCLLLDFHKMTGTLAVPFNANLAVVLYRCEQYWRGRPQFKVMSMWNEIPVKIRGCPDKICPLEDFVRRYKHVFPFDPEDLKPVKTTVKSSAIRHSSQATTEEVAQDPVVVTEEISRNSSSNILSILMIGIAIVLVIMAAVTITAACLQMKMKKSAKAEAAKKKTKRSRSPRSSSSRTWTKSKT